ncbi:MAG: hypothetical protein ACQKBY_02780 [Verrucomicrobiales bacterium]
MIAGIALFSSSISGLLQAQEAAENYRAKVGPVLEQYVLGKQSKHYYTSEQPKPMTLDDQIELIHELQKLNFDMDRQESPSSLRYQLFGSVALLVAGQWLIVDRSKTKLRKPVTQQGDTNQATTRRESEISDNYNR